MKAIEKYLQDCNDIVPFGQMHQEVRQYAELCILETSLAISMERLEYKTKEMWMNSTSDGIRYEKLCKELDLTP